MGCFKDKETMLSYALLLQCYRSLNVRFQLFEEYAMQYALWFQRNISGTRIRNFEFSNIAEVHRFFIDNIYKDSVNKLDNYQIKTLDYYFKEIIKDRNYYIHEYFFDYHDNCIFIDECGNTQYINEILKDEELKLRNRRHCYDEYIQNFKTILKIDKLKKTRAYKISSSTKSIDVNQYPYIMLFDKSFFYTIQWYSVIETDLYTLFKYIQKQQKCFDDDFMKNLSHCSLGQYGKILKEKMKDNKVYLAIHDYIKNFDEFFKKIDEINIDRNYLLHGLFPKYFVNNTDDYNRINVTNEDEKICFKMLQAAIRLDKELENILDEYDIKLNKWSSDEI